MSLRYNNRNNNNNNHKSCVELASELSSNFRNVSPVPEGQESSIPSYLSSHGILFTMCFPWACAINTAKSNHIAASWINAAIGPTHAIPAPSNMGLILDPSLADIDCIYPTDAATDGRDGQGCGALAMDPKYATRMNPLKRWYLKRLINSYKDFNFAHTEWEDIMCEDFFGVPHLPSTYDSSNPQLAAGPQSQIFWTWGDDEDGIYDFDSIDYQSYLTVSQNTEQAIMGHPVCSVADPTPPFDEGFLIYYGEKGLPLQHWQYVMDTQQHMITNLPPNTLIWNEIVIKLPTRLEDIVQAVFYVDSPDMNPEVKADLREKAEREAHLLGNKPLLKVDLVNYYGEEGGGGGGGKDLLVCDKDDDGNNKVSKDFESFSYLL